MLTTIELALLALSLAWLAMLAAIGLFYLKLRREQEEVRRMREKIDRTEESFRKVSGSFLALKGMSGSL